VADGRLQQLEQVRVSVEEVGVREMGVEVGAEQQWRMQGGASQQAQTRHQKQGRSNLRQVNETVLSPSTNCFFPFFHAAEYDHEK